MAQDPLNLLCVEPRFPGRLGAVADWLVRKRGYRAWFYCHGVGPRESWPAATGQGLEVVQFGVGGVAREPSVHWTRNLERGLCYAYGAWEVLSARRPGPVDVVLGRSAGLGSTLFVPPFAPRVPIVQLLDYYYHPRAHDLTELYAPRLPADYIHWRLAANAMDLLDLENGVVPWTLSRWQRNLFPAEYRGDFRVIPEGVELGRVHRRRGRSVAGRTIPDSTFVLSFVASDLDPLRGFDRFLAVANGMMRAGIDVVALAVGSREVRRSLDILNFGREYAAGALAADPPPDLDRLWLLGEVAPAIVSEVLAATDLHCYPSRPYPAGRSLFEALAGGAAVLAWDSAPVREVLEGASGAAALCSSEEALDRALTLASDPDARADLGERAASLARERFDRDATLPTLAEMLDRLAKTGRP